MIIDNQHLDCPGTLRHVRILHAFPIHTLLSLRAELLETGSTGRGARLSLCGARSDLGPGWAARTKQATRGLPVLK
jgi:hypothetical protein